MSLTALAEFTKVRLTLVCDPPDATGGWSAQFQRRLVGASTWSSHGTRDSSPPFSRSSEVARGEYEVQAVLTKSGLPTVTLGPTRIVATAAPVTVTWDPAPPDPPIDCQWSAWSAWSAWSDNGDGTESRTRTRTILVHEQNGGAPCVGPSVETETRQIAPPPPPPPGGLLQPSDLTYLGKFLTPDHHDMGTQWSWSMGTFTGRRVGNEVRLFLTGHSHEGHQVYEFRPNGFDQRGTMVRNWGVVGRYPLRDTNQGYEMRGLAFVDGKLWWAYGSQYFTGQDPDPSIGCTLLNADGTVTIFGPWRTSEHSQRTRGYMMEIPADFSFAGGRRVAVGAPTTSGNAQGPRGTVLTALDVFDPATLPPDQAGDGITHVSANGKRLIYSDHNHPMPRPASEPYTLCAFNTPNDPSSGSYLLPDDPTFNNHGDHDYALDVVCGVTWVRTANVEGIVAVGQITAIVPGKTYPGDGKPHMWYGPANQPCGHGHRGEPSVGTGPQSDSQAPMLWIYAPNDIATAVNPWDVVPRSATKLNTLSPAIGGQVSTDRQISGCWFDAVDRKLYVVDRFGADNYGPVPVIHVWQVR